MHPDMLAVSSFCVKCIILERGLQVRSAYPCQITPCEGGELVVSFPDVPGALTSGYSRAEALEAAAEALSVMLAGLVEDRKAIPVPSPALDGQEIVAVDPLTAAKLEQYSAMRD